MRKLEEIGDVATLQQVAILLEKQVLNQAKLISELRAEVSRLRGNTVDPQMELDLLKEQLAALQKKVYGASSEKRPKQMTERPPKPEKTGHGPRPQPDLPVVEVQHELPEDERTCPSCGKTMTPMGEGSEDSEEITVVGVEYKVLKHRRQKYRCTCTDHVLTAPGPAKLIPGGRYTVDFAVHVAEQKYLDHLPLERQARAMARAGLMVESQTLWDQVDALASHLEPTYQALLQNVLESPLVYADETQWRLMERTGTSKWWTWCVANDEIATYRNLPTRSKKAAATVLDGYTGIVMSDGFAAYNDLARAGPQGKATLVHCWAHVRRKFVEAEDAYPELSEWAVKKIGELFEVEREIRLHKQAHPDGWEEICRALRNERSRELCGKLKEWAIDHRGRVLPGSKMGRAINYMLGLWAGLTRFLEDPQVPLDNNAAERALRGVVVGRKNHYGSRSKRGADVAALFYTLFETAKLSGVDPRTYVREAATRAIHQPGAVTLPSDLT